MNNYIFRDDNGQDWKRITKKAAKKAYIAGHTVTIVPCNLRPFGPWGIGCNINRKDRAAFVADEIGVKNDFNNLVNSHEYYNCINSETGRYSAFYIQVDKVD